MTSSWKLLYIWKSLGGRSSEPAAVDPAPDSPGDSNPRRTRHRHGRGNRSHNHDDPNPLPRSQSARIHARNHCHRASQSEYESVRLDQRASGDLATSSGNNGDSVGIPSRMRLIRNNQLPDSVIQARQRLVERLGNVSLAGTRESARVSGISWEEVAENYNVSSEEVVHGANTSSRDWFNDNMHRIDFTLDGTKMKISGVSWEAVCALHLEVFGETEETREIRASPECCSICLESFSEGDVLIRLHCGHRFHRKCLHPWVQTCSRCPYCRANIP